MPTDATGTPTSLGIPTLNVDVDEPSGLGFNEAMVIIDSLLVSRSGVSSFVGRSGAVTANTGDYTAAKVTNAADKSSGSTQAFTGAITVGGATSTFGSTGVVLQTGGTIWAAASIASSIFVGSVTGDTERRISMTAGGQVLFGPGNAATDCTVERFAANTLRATNTGILSSSPTVGIGYMTGAGGSVTQLTSQSTAVTLNNVTGQVNMFTGPITAGQVIQFTVNNTTVTANDVVILSGIGSGIVLSASAFAGGFAVTLQNVTGSNKPSASYNLNFAVIKGAIS